MYGLERYYNPVATTTVECKTLPTLLQDFGIAAIDFLKTDLEGLDFEVLQSCESLLPRIAAIQCELRLQPFYEGESYFHEAAAYLTERGFELVALKPEFWKPKTTRNRNHKDGRTVWADCLFLRATGMTLLDYAKQIVILSMIGRRGYAEHVLESNRDALPAEWIGELESLVKPRRTLRETAIWKVLRRIRNALSSFDLSHIAER